MDEEVISFKATITYERYYNQDSCWGVYGFATFDNIPYFISQTTSDDPFDPIASAESDRKFACLAGKMQQLRIGAEYEIKATYHFDKKYGHQYVPTTVYAILPKSKKSQLIFLQTLTSQSNAKELLKAYPNVVNDVLDGTLTDIDCSRVKGVGDFTWHKIKNGILDNYIISDIITLLKPIGVTFPMIKKLLEEQPNTVLLKQELLDNPYVMTRINGIGFKKCDELALKLKPAMLETTQRLAAFITYYFRELGENEGHTWVSASILEQEISNNVPECQHLYPELLEHNNFLYIEDGKIGLIHYHNIEQKIIDIIERLCDIDGGNWFSDGQINRAIKEAEEEQGFIYTEEQVAVIRNTLNSNVNIITGKAGTGKSSILRAIIKAYSQNDMSVTAAALSAMAAQRITEATQYPASTIHRALGCIGFNKFTYNANNKLVTRLAFMDEASMVNARLFLNWLEAIGDDTHVIIAGDHKQLPPIGYGNVFSDIIEILDKKHVNVLTKPMRQAKKSGILTDANLIRENRNPITETVKPKLIHGELQDMYYMFRSDRQSIFDTAIKLYMSAIETESVDDVVIITPRKQGCLNSTFEFNKAIQDLLLGQEKKEVPTFNCTYKLGAKVMQTVNDYDRNVFNGEIGYITHIGTEDDKKKSPYCDVTYDDLLTGTKVVRYNEKELLQLDLAYAITTHKSQGSGKKTVIGVIDNTHYQLLDNCMLYTLITRAKKRCCLVAEPQAFTICLKTSHNQRNTWLKNMKG